MGDERALVFTPKTSPIKLRTYSWKDFVDEMAIPPPKRDKIAVDEGLFHACEQARKTPEWQTSWAQAAPPELNYIHETISDTAEVSNKPVDIFTTPDQAVSKGQEESPAKAQESVEPEPVDSEQELEGAVEDDPYGSGAVI